MKYRYKILIIIIPVFILHNVAYVFFLLQNNSPEIVFTEEKVIKSGFVNIMRVYFICDRSGETIVGVNNPPLNTFNAIRHNIHTKELIVDDLSSFEVEVDLTYTIIFIPFKKKLLITYNLIDEDTYKYRMTYKYLD